MSTEPNEQIAARLGLHDARAISRTNGQIYAAWGLAGSTTDEKVARTRAALIYQRRQMMMWDEDGTPRVADPIRQMGGAEYGGIDGYPDAFNSDCRPGRTERSRRPDGL